MLFTTFVIQERLLLQRLLSGFKRNGVLLFLCPLSLQLHCDLQRVERLASISLGYLRKKYKGILGNL